MKYVSSRLHRSGKTVSSFVRRYSSFTLVELLITVAILSILGVIGLVSFSGYNSNSRDSTRIEDLINIQKYLSLSAVVTGKFPLPDNGVPIYNSGSFIQTQGYAGKNVLTTIKFNGTGLDPLDSQYYTYAVTNTQTGSELLAYLENQSNLTLTSYGLNTLRSTYADSTNYANRYPMTRGDPIGILTLSGSLVPLQAMGGTGIDLATNQTLYTAYIQSRVSITGSGASFGSAF